MAELPSGTVTFLLTDIEGSTALWRRNCAVMAQAVATIEEREEMLSTDRGRERGKRQLG